MLKPVNALCDTIRGQNSGLVGREWGERLWHWHREGWWPWEHCLSFLCLFL